MLERVLLKRAEWQRQGGSIVFVWTPGHRGLYFNHMADAVAKGHIGRAATRYAQPIGRRASLVQYEVRPADGTYSWMAGERRLVGLMQRAIGGGAARRAAENSGKEHRE